MDEKTSSGNYLDPKAVLAQINAPRRIGPANVLVLYRNGDAIGQAVAQYYQLKRGIPAGNVVALAVSWLPTSNDMSTADANAILATLAPVLLATDIRAIVTCNWFPQTINGGIINFGNFLSCLLEYSTLAAANRYNSNVDWEATTNFASNYTSVSALSMAPLAGAYESQTQYGMMPPAGYAQAYTADIWLPHFRLEVSPVAAGDTRIANASVQNYLQKIIDDSIAAEQAQYADLGTVVCVGSGSYSGTWGSGLTVALPAWWEASGKARVLYCDQLGNELCTIPRSTNIATLGLISRTVTGNNMVMCVGGGATAAAEAAWNIGFTGAITVDGTVQWAYMGPMPANVYPAGATTLTPNRIGQTYVPLSDVFIRVIGEDAYYSQTTQPEQQSDLAYRQGAIVMFSQSYGYISNPIAGLDYDFGAPLPNAMADTACATATPIHYTNGNNFVVNGFSFASTAATPTVGVSGSDILLKSAGTIVATIALSGTLREQYAAIQAALPAGWTMTVEDPWLNSRCDTAIKNGACAAFGACAEPYTNGAIKGHFIQNLWDGMSLGECAYTLAQATYYATAAFNLFMVGDPLYRPFQ